MLTDCCRSELTKEIIVAAALKEFANYLLISTPSDIYPPSMDRNSPA
jgi:hypothetical protein